MAKHYTVQVSATGSWVDAPFYCYKATHPHTAVATAIKREFSHDGPERVVPGLMGQPDSSYSARYPNKLKDDEMLQIRVWNCTCEGGHDD